MQKQTLGFLHPQLAAIPAKGIARPFLENTRKAILRDTKRSAQVQQGKCGISELFVEYGKRVLDPWIPKGIPIACRQVLPSHRPARVQNTRKARQRKIPFSQYWYYSIAMDSGICGDHYPKVKE
ncbi:MAG: hypothetical protein ACRD34_03025 [Bryobacteraceae bacterium]